jgi:hypothetical protein
MKTENTVFEMIDMDALKTATGGVDVSGSGGDPRYNLSGSSRDPRNTLPTRDGINGPDRSSAN